MGRRLELSGSLWTAGAYEIDLSAGNAQALRDAFAPSISAARRVGAAKQMIDLRTKESHRSGETSAIRGWAIENEIPVNARGRISLDLLARYQAAH